MTTSKNVTSRKTSLLGILGIAMAVSTTIASANSGSPAIALRGTASDTVWHFRTVFNPSAGKGDLPHGASQH